MVAYFNSVYSASRDLSHWSSWERRPSMHRILPGCSVVFSSGKDEILQYLHDGLMVPVGLSVI